jgi:hypothetical protein
MAISVRAFLQSIAGLALALAGGAARAQQRETLTLSAFIARVRGDDALRARFADNPSFVLREYGIDPTPFSLPDKITEAQMNSLLDDLSRRAPPQTAQPETAPPPPRQPSPAVPVYGPPPGMRRP